jgi:hypothetical protein
MPKWNGGVIGVANNPTISSAKGIWSLSEATKAIRAGLWPPSNAGADPYFENVTMLLSADGTNGAQNNTFLDSSTNNFTITRNGNTTQGTFTPFSKADGRWSMYQSDSASNYINFTTSAGTLFQFTGDYTIEMWVYITSISGDGSLYVVSDNSNYHALNIDATNYNLYINSTSINASFSHGLALNQWNHVAMVRNGSTITVYTNGVSKGTASNSGTNGYSSPAIARNGGGVANVRYTSNYRVVKGTAVYTSAFTPPTAPLTAISGTSLLTGQNNRFIDNSSNALAITLSGTPSIQTFSPFPTLTAYASGTNGGSGYFDGTGDFLSFAADTAFAFGTGDYTVEAWIYLTSVTTTDLQVIFMSGSTGGNNFYFHVDGNQISVGTNAAFISNQATTITANQWYHIAACRSGTTLRLFVNGTQAGSNATDSTSWISSGTARVGSNEITTQLVNGYMSSVRVLKGTAQYTANFTPPTAPLTAITNTSLLLSGTNGGIIDNAMSNDLETVGNAQISTTQSKFGGASMYFDGNDKCVMPYTQNFNLGTTYTIEAWIYPTTVSGYQRIFDIVNSATSSPAFLDVALNGTALVSELRTANGGGVTTISGGTVSANTWSHVALSVSAGSAKLFLNGTQVGSTTTLSALPDQNFVGIGGIGNSLTIDYLTGYIDDLRITKGYARYTANFTAPVVPFPLFGD